MTQKDIDELVGTVASLTLAYKALVHVLHERRYIEQQDIADMLRGVAERNKDEPGFGLLSDFVAAFESTDDTEAPAWLQGVIDGGES
jgi:hypothetical protein